MSYDIRIENFEGPLDLLLHLIQKNEMDIYDIPIAEITSQYLATLGALKTLDLDLASEFLLMAATLTYIKSRMLLPQAEPEAEDEDGEDPRAELVRRLLEYQRYKDAAETLDGFSLLERDVFKRTHALEQFDGEDEKEFESVGLYQLVEAFRRLLQELPEDAYHEVTAEQLSVTERINSLLAQLEGHESLGFSELFRPLPTRPEVVVTFLAMLELVKLRLVRFMQNSKFGPIRLYPAVGPDEPDGSILDEEALGYE